MESEKYICVRETVNGQESIAIIETANPANMIRRPITAEAAIMHPEQPILTLKAGATIQIYNIDLKRMVKQTAMTEEVVFWKWVSNTTLALVTGTAVLHWSMEGDAAPAKVFDRHADLAACQIINYRADESAQWLCLVGISQKEGRIAGNMQLYSTARQVSQSIEGHACAFSQHVAEGATTPSTLFVFAVRTATAAKLYILEVEKGTNSQFQKKAVDIVFPPEAAGDFPVAVQVTDKVGIAYVLTKFGYVHLFDVGTGSLIYRNRISSETIFLSAFHKPQQGIIGVNRKGQVLLVTIDEQNLVPFTVNTVRNVGLAIQLASRGNLPGAEQLFSAQFQQLFQAGQYKDAARVAAASPGDALRNAQTIALFQRLPATPGQPSPLLQYFGTLLERGKLNKVESLELVRPVLAQGRKELLENWLKEDKLECSEELGDLVKAVDTTLALSVYFRAEAKAKVVLCFAETGQYDKIVAYATKVGYTPDYNAILQAVLASNLDAAVKFAQMLLLNPAGALVDPNVVIDAFIAKRAVPQITTVLLEALKANRADQGPLQTRLLELNLQFAPQVADAILGNEVFSHYNRQRIAELCEKVGLQQRALQHYTDPKDIKRCLVRGAQPGPGGAAPVPIDPEFLASYFGTLSIESTLDILKDMLRTNVRGNLQTVVTISAKYSEQIGPKELIDMYETFKCYDGMFFYLGQIVNSSEDALVHLKYIDAAVKTRNYKEVERIARDSNHYDAAAVREYLKEAKLPDQLPLIIVCDRFGFVDDLTKYLYKNNLSRYIEAYVQQINPANAAIVVGALLDSNCNDDYIKKLVMSIRGLCPVDALVEETAKRNRLKLLQPWLEQRVQEGNEEAQTHNALGKIYIDLNKDAEQFLKTNAFYESEVLGKYCEKRNPYLAFVAYRRGKCSKELIDVTNANKLFKNQARYLVERQDAALWASVLSTENEHRQALVDEVVSTALPETKNPEEISNTVRAFMAADMPTELIGLLEKIVLDSSADSEFANNRNLQNLLILTAIKAKPERVMEYINRLDKYDGADIAGIAIGAGLFEEALAIFKKQKLHLEAIQVLIEHVKDLDRAQEFADRVAEKPVFSLLGKAQMHGGRLPQAIASFLKADDADYYRELTGAAQDANLHELVIDYLRMCRPKVQDSFIDTELAYSFAKTERLAELEEFVTNTNVAQIEQVGDRCVREGMYKAAKLLYASIDNYPGLASCLIKLQDYQGAADAAKKSGAVNSFKEVCFACVDAKEFKIAQQCGLNVIVEADELEELVYHYERRGAFDEAIALLEKGVTLEKAHKGIFTELAVLYSKFREEKLMDFLRASANKLHAQKAIRACQTNLQWAELTHLYVAHDEIDNATVTMIDHPTAAWDHTRFKDCVVKVNNHDLYYKAIQFYAEQQPTLVNDLLKALTPKIDHSRVVPLARRMQKLALVKPYLQSVQDSNTLAVNEALNELYVEEEAFADLRKSIDTYDAFDNIALAKTLEKHQLMELRRIAAYLYARNKRWTESIALSKTDKLFKDAMVTAAQSGDAKLAHDLLRYFVEHKHHECFAAALYTCYDLIAPDVAIELAWRNKVTDFAAPWFIQFIKEKIDKLDKLWDASQPKKQKEGEGEHPESFQSGGLGPQLAIGWTDPAAGGAPQFGAPQGFAAPGFPGAAGFAPPQGFGVPPQGFGVPPQGFGGFGGGF
jgi:clathrin heavy chain